MIIREERDLRCVSISSTQVSGAVVLSEGWLGRFSYPLCYLPPAPPRAQREGGTHAFSPKSQSPLFLCLSLTVQGTHQLRFAGQMPRCPCSCGTFLNTSRSQTTPSAKSSNQTQCPADLSPKAKSRSWEVFWAPDAPQGSLFCLTVCLPRDSITCVHVSGSALSP